MEWQRQQTGITFGFPANRVVFEERVARARQGDETAFWAGVRLLPAQLPEDTSAFVEITLALIDSAEGLPSWIDPIINIVYEGLDDLFTGRSTPQEAARIIQSRAAIYVAEQS